MHILFPIRSMDIFNLPTHSSRTMALGSTPSLTQENTRNLLECKERPERKRDEVAGVGENIAMRSSITYTLLQV
jgi:hypothetical protein